MLGQQLQAGKFNGIVRAGVIKRWRQKIYVYKKNASQMLAQSTRKKLEKKFNA